MFTITLALSLLAPAQDSAAPDPAALAQQILDKGSSIFDSRDAKAMAATYIADAEVILLTEKDGQVTPEYYRGTAEIERGYAELFKDREPNTRSQNKVEAAHFIGKDVLLIHGVFIYEVGKDGAFPFLQTRIRSGDTWKIANMQVFGISENDKP